MHGFGNIGSWHRTLCLECHVFELHLAPGPIVGADDDRIAGAAGAGLLELLAKLLARESILDAVPRVAKFMGEAEGIGAIVFGNDGNEGVEPSHARGDKPAVLEQLTQHHVAHAEADAGKIDPAKCADQGVIAPAPADGAEGLARVEELEDVPV